MTPLERHRAHHLTKSLVQAAQKRETESNDLLTRIERSHARAEKLYGIAENILERCQDSNMSLKAINSCCTVLEQSRKWTELLAQLTGALQAQNAGKIEIVVRYEDKPIKTVDVTSESELLQ
jgi:hypothetical protein